MAEVVDQIQDGAKGIYRWARNVASGASDTEIKVKDATNNDKWGPTGQQMKEISELSHSPEQFNIIMNTIWKRLNDNGKFWRHVYKALTLLEYMVKNGSEQVVRACLANLEQIRTLRQFQFVSDLGKDEGQNVRQKAKLIVELLSDKDRLRDERKKARENAGKYNQALSSDGWGHTGQDAWDRPSDRGRDNNNDDWGRGRSQDRDRSGGGRNRSRSPSPFGDRRRSPSPDRRDRDRDRDRDWDRRDDRRDDRSDRREDRREDRSDRREERRGGGRRDSRSPSPVGRQQSSSGGAPRGRAPSGGATNTPAPQRGVVQQQQSSQSLLFDLPVQQQSPAQQSFGAFPPGGGFDPRAAQSPSQGSFGAFPQQQVPQQQMPQQQQFGSFNAMPVGAAPMASGNSFDFNPRAQGAAGGVGLPTQQSFGAPPAAGASFPQTTVMQPQNQSQPWADFGSFQGANSLQARPGDIVSTNQHLYNLDHLSQPAVRPDAGAVERKKTLAELAAENTQRQPVLHSAPRYGGGAPPVPMATTTTTTTTMTMQPLLVPAQQPVMIQPQQMTYQQQLEYQQQLQLQMQMARMQMQPGQQQPMGYPQQQQGSGGFHL